MHGSNVVSRRATGSRVAYGSIPTRIVVLSRNDAARSADRSDAGIGRLARFRPLFIPDMTRLGNHCCKSRRRNVGATLAFGIISVRRGAAAVYPHCGRRQIKVIARQSTRDMGYIAAEDTAITVHRVSENDGDADEADYP